MSMAIFENVKIMHCPSRNLGGKREALKQTFNL